MTRSRFLMRICKIAGQSRITRMLGNKLDKIHSPIEARYYRRYGLNRGDVCAGAALVFIAAYLGSSLLLYWVVGYLFILLSLLVGYGCSEWFYNWIPRRLAKEKLVISREVPIISQEIILASAGSGSIFNLVTLVAEGRHPIVSRAFSRILERTNNGDRPETLVMRFASHQPCEALRRTLLDALSLGLDWEKMKRALQYRKGEAEFEYEKRTMQLESRILLSVGLGTFCPIIFSIAVFVNGMWRNLTSMVLVALLFFVVLFVLEWLLMKPIRDVHILGEYHNVSRRKGPSNHGVKEELEETIVIISLLGEFLFRENIPPESAIKRLSETYNGWLSPILNEMTMRISYNGETFTDAWLWFRKKFANTQCRQILGTVPRMIDNTAEAAGERLMEVASYVKDNQTLIEERESIFSAQRFKAKLLSLLSSASLGLMTALSPLFTIVGTRQFSPAIPNLYMWSHETLVTVIVLLLMTITNTYNAMKAVGTERWPTYTCISASIFLTVFVVSSRLIVGLV